MAVTTLPPRDARPGHQWLATVVWRTREVIGPKSYTRYSFNPWAEVEEADVQGFRNATTTRGCECTGNAERIPVFATLAEIQSGQVVPNWS